ncbi:hypothetical protein U0070_024203, partial [Myodes glareolus]
MRQDWDRFGSSRAYTYSLTWVRCVPIGRVLRERLAKENPSSSWAAVRSSGVVRSGGHQNLEGNVSLRSSAAVFTYCKSRGLFAGISLEGSCLIERKETNRKFYCQDIRAYDILFGDVPQPAQAEDLYEILNSFTEKYENDGQRINLRKAAREQKKVLSKGFLFVSAKELPPKPSSRPQRSLAPVQSNGSQSNGNEYKLYPELSSYREKT